MSRVSYKDDESKGEFQQPVKVLVPSAISGGVIHEENLGTAVLKKEVSEERITKEGDIAIKLSSPYDCALITSDDIGYVIPSFCALIRGVDENLLDLHYLVGYMNSSLAISDLVASINSTSMAMVRGKSLEELEIVFPTLQEQRVAGQAYRLSCMKKQSLQRMEDQQQKISDTVILETIKEVIRHEK